MSRVLRARWADDLMLDLELVSSRVNLRAVSTCMGFRTE